MQLSDEQFDRSLEALRHRPEPDGDVPAEGDHPVGEVSAEIVRRLLDGPPVRADRVAAVKARLDAGAQPSSRDLADKLVGRLVADRLR